MSDELPRELRDADDEVAPRRRSPVWHRVLAGLVVAAMVLSLLLYTALAFL